MKKWLIGIPNGSSGDVRKVISQGLFQSFWLRGVEDLVNGTVFYQNEETFIRSEGCKEGLVSIEVKFSRLFSDILSGGCQKEDVK